jgi:ribosomal protein S18 acetylase RimI-like enzyme
MADATAATGIEVRYATAADCGAVVALIESAYRGDSSRAGWTTEADLLGGQRTDADEIGAILRDPAARLLLAIAGGGNPGEVIGCVLVRREVAGAYLGMLAVRPGLQAKGVGKALLAEAEARARRDFGANRVRMTVIEQRRELIAWYVRRGYTPTGDTEPFPYGNPRFGLPRRDDLRFVVLAKAI